MKEMKWKDKDKKNFGKMKGPCEWKAPYFSFFVLHWHSKNWDLSMLFLRAATVGASAVASPIWFQYVIVCDYVSLSGTTNNLSMIFPMQLY